jgi:hypothetical protein
MKNFYLLLLFLANLIYSQSNLNWQALNPKPTHNYGKDILFLSETNGFYITDTELVETKNAGESWSIKKQITSGVDIDFKNNTGIIVGNWGSAYLSKDEGDTWQFLNINSSDSFIYSKVINNNSLIVASNTNIYFSNNGGSSWTQKNITIYSPRKIYFLNENVGFLGTGDGKMYKTIDGGNTWVLKNTVNYIPADYFTIYFYNDQIGFAERGHGELLRTLDGGETWTKITTVSDHIFSFYFVNENLGYATGEDGVTFKTTDGGANWSNIFFQTGRIGGTDMYGIFFTSSSTGYAVGSRGRIIKTTNGGTAWKVYSPFYNDVNNINIVDDEIFARVGLDVFNSKDDGFSWEKLTRPAEFIPENIWSYTNYSSGMSFVSKSVGYLIGGPYYGQARIYKTTDGGLSWIKKYDFYPMDGISSICFINENVGFVSGGFNNDSTYKTIDGGNTWSLVNNISFSKIKFLSNNVGYGVDNSRYVRQLYKTKDAGLTWNVIASYEYDINDFYFTDEQNGYLVGSSSLKLQKTTDGGNTWKKQEIPYEWYDLVRFKNKNVGLIATEYGQIYTTFNGGKTWKSDYKYLASNDLQFGNGNVYLGGINGRIFKSSIQNIPEYALTTDEVTNISNKSATFNASVASNSSTINYLMFEFSKNPGFNQISNIAANKEYILADDSDDLFTFVSGLEASTTYYVRLSGMHNGVKVYGNIVSFKTLPDYNLTLNNVYPYYATSVDLGGLGSAIGNDITDIEFEYSENQNQFTNSFPSNLQTITIGNKDVYLTSKIQNLKPETLYYARVKAKYENNIVYSNIVSFTTKKEYDLKISEAYIYNDNVYLNADVYANDKDISNIVFEYGDLSFENSVNASPSEVSGLNSIYTSIVLPANSFIPNKNYYVRLKAITNGKTIYSNTVIFNLDKKLILTKDENEIVADTSIKLNGLVKAFDYSAITDIKFEYGKTEGLGSELPSTPSYSYYTTTTLKITANLTGLETNQKYYYKISAVQNGEKRYSDLYEFTLTPLSVSDINKNEIAIYPNPVKEIINFKSPNNISKIEIYDLSGKLLLSKSTENIDNLDIHNLSNAIYIVKIYSKGEIVTKKIIKQ